ncbi:hypothetical protein GQ55_5G212000 [Panicum hallii var. hallii]|uniref:Uncharacterized protein n=1 Tax=Panicum hallii var. hallii TaxID=1504633 RepID=A0A2T7DIN2_9POAL|nr:hypothetical protein GQ55_5G212000 [Panicum hallii var. hallii]
MLYAGVCFGVPVLASVPRVSQSKSKRVLCVPLRFWPTPCVPPVQPTRVRKEGKKNRTGSSRSPSPPPRHPVRMAGVTLLRLWPSASRCHLPGAARHSAYLLREDKMDAKVMVHACFQVEQRPPVKLLSPDMAASNRAN